MKIILWIVAVLVALVLVIVVVGYSLPVRHTASREQTYSVDAPALYVIITSVEKYPEWRTGVSKTEQVDDNGSRLFRETSSDGTILYSIEDAIPGKRWVTRIADKSLPFGGTWTYELEPQTSGTRLRITENGEVYNPVFRFVSRFIMGHTHTIDRYLEDLQRRVSGVRQ